MQTNTRFPGNVYTALPHPHDAQAPAQSFNRGGRA